MGRVLDDGIALFRTSFKRVYPYALIGALLMALPSIFAPDLPRDSDVQVTMGPIPALLGLGPMFVIFWIAALVCYQIAFAIVMLKMVNGVADNPYTSDKNIFVNAFAKGILLLIPTILYFIVLLLASMAFLIPGIIVGLSMFLYTPLVVLRNTGIFRSLAASHRLVWGNWWRTATIITVPMILIFVISMIVATVWGLSTSFRIAFDTNEQPAALHLANAVASSLTIPMLVAVMITVMHDLRLRREGADLEARLSG